MQSTRKYPSCRMDAEDASHHSLQAERDKQQAGNCFEPADGQAEQKTSGMKCQQRTEEGDRTNNRDR